MADAVSGGRSSSPIDPSNSGRASPADSGISISESDAVLPHHVPPVVPALNWASLHFTPSPKTEENFVKACKLESPLKGLSNAQMESLTLAVQQGGAIGKYIQEAAQERNIEKLRGAAEGLKLTGTKEMLSKLENLSRGSGESVEALRSDLVILAGNSSPAFFGECLQDLSTLGTIFHSATGSSTTDLLEDMTTLSENLAGYAKLTDRRALAAVLANVTGTVPYFASEELSDTQRINFEALHAEDQKVFWEMLKGSVQDKEDALKELSGTVKGATAFAKLASSPLLALSRKIGISVHQLASANTEADIQKLTELASSDAGIAEIRKANTPKKLQQLIETGKVKLTPRSDLSKPERAFLKKIRQEPPGDLSETEIRGGISLLGGPRYSSKTDTIVQELNRLKQTSPEEHQKLMPILTEYFRVSDTIQSFRPEVFTNDDPRLLEICYPDGLDKAFGGQLENYEIENLKAQGPIAFCLGKLNPTLLPNDMVVAKAVLEDIGLTATLSGNNQPLYEADQISYGRDSAFASRVTGQFHRAHGKEYAVAYQVHGAVDLDTLQEDTIVDFTGTTKELNFKAQGSIFTLRLETPLSGKMTVKEAKEKIEIFDSILQRGVERFERAPENQEFIKTDEYAHMKALALKATREFSTARANFNGTETLKEGWAARATPATAHYLALDQAGNVNPAARLEAMAEGHVYFKEGRLYLHPPEVQEKGKPNPIPVTIRDEFRTKESVTMNLEVFDGPGKTKMAPVTFSQTWEAIDDWGKGATRNLKHVTSVKVDGKHVDRVSYYPLEQGERVEDAISRAKESSDFTSGMMLSYSKLLDAQKRGAL